MEFVSRFANGVVHVRTKPRYNIAPSQSVSVLLLDKTGLTEKEMRWGWTTNWSKQLLTNAQSETVKSKRTFVKAFEKRRCLVPADGFYEWQTVLGKKQPVRFVLKSGAPFCFAGLWEACPKPPVDGVKPDSDFPDEPSASELVESALILTTAANDIVVPVHGRMPVILQEQHYDWWLDGGNLADMAMTHPRNGELEWYRVSPLVNNARTDDVKCIARLDQPRSG